MAKTGLIDLQGKAALVTGAGRRVGAAIAKALGSQGMRVAIHHRGSPEGAAKTLEAVRAAGGDGVVLAADLSDRAAARKLVDEAVSALGGLDVLVPSAASFERVPLGEVDDAAWDRTMALNLDGPFALAHHAIPALRASHGSMVFITCTSATRPFANYLPYVVSKGAIRQLMRTLALELAPDVRVNAVAPGTVLPPEDMTARVVASLVREIPLGRTGTAEDVAEAVVYLARASFVTGEELAIDGGHLLQE